MAEKDFAMDTGQLSNNHAGNFNPYKTILIVVAAVAFSIVCFTLGFQMGEKHGVETTQGKKHQDLVQKLQSQQQELETLKQAAATQNNKEATTSQVGELTFYNELPKQSVVPEPLQESKMPEKNVPNLRPSDDMQSVEKNLEALIQQELQSSSRTFRVQVASFTQHSDAEHFLPKLQSLGLTPQIQKVTLPNIGTRYRVFSQSFMQEQDGIRAKQLIKEKLHLDGILIQND